MWFGHNFQFVTVKVRIIVDTFDVTWNSSQLACVSCEVGAAQYTHEYCERIQAVLKQSLSWPNKIPEEGDEMNDKVWTSSSALADSAWWIWCWRCSIRGERSITRGWSYSDRRLMLYIESPPTEPVSKDISSSISCHITLCSPLKVNRWFEGTCCLHLRGSRVIQVRKLCEASSKHSYAMLSYACCLLQGGFLLGIAMLC